MTIFLISAVAAKGFFRAGTFFPKEGVRKRASDFTEEAWAAIKAEPNLHIREVEDDEDLPDPGTEARFAVLDEVISALPDEGFGSDGKPKVSAINKLLDAGAEPTDAKERDAVWAEMVAAGASTPAS
ncbi:MAG: hypothetical protein ACU0CO_10315 [Shimia sp.]